MAIAEFIARQNHSFVKYESLYIPSHTTVYCMVSEMIITPSKNMSCLKQRQLEIQSGKSDQCLDDSPEDNNVIAKSSEAAA